MARINPPNTGAQQVRLVLTVVSTFGLGSILVVVVGRLWTIAYFEHFGLSAADLEFSIEDFAFRSLEVFISLVLAGAGVFLAWRAKPILRWAGLWFLVIEFAFAAGAVAIMFWALEPLVEWQPSLSKTGVLGIIGGIALILMIILVADIWFGSGGGRKGGGRRKKRGTPGALYDWLRVNPHKVFAAGMMLGIVFVYVPFVTQNLARLQAEIDLEKGRLPAAFLEADKDLPVGVASDADPTKSVAVRVILTSSGNTFVLNSTTCKTIGEAAAFISRSKDGRFVATDNTEVCKVFAIPTDQLTSIEYIQVDDIAASNDNFARPEEVSLEDAFVKNVSTEFAESQLIHCNLDAYEQQLEAEDAATPDEAERLDSDPSSTEEDRPAEDSRKYKTLWYLIKPVAAGTLKVTARVLEKNTGENHAVGIWEEQPEEVPKPLLGSHQGLACLNESLEDELEEEERKIAVIANVQQGASYLVSLGSQHGGDATLEIEFNPGAHYFNEPPGADDAAGSNGAASGEPAPEGQPEGDGEPSPDAASFEVLVEADEAIVTVQLSALDAKTFEENPFEDEIELTLTSAATAVAAATDEAGPDEVVLGESQQPVILAPDDVGVWTVTGVSAGLWTVTIQRKDGDRFIGHARITVANAREMVIALNDALGVDRDLQRALFLLANAAAEGFEDEPVSVDGASFAQSALTSKSEDEVPEEGSEQTEIEKIIETAKLPDGFDVQVQIEGEEETLGALANALANEISQAGLNEISQEGLEARVSDCQEDADVCFRVFRRGSRPGDESQPTVEPAEGGTR